MKVFLHIKLEGTDDIDINVSGIKTKNTYKYKENNILVIVKVDKNSLTINRHTDEYDINLVFNDAKSSTSTYSVFGGSKIFKLETYTNKLKIYDDKIELEYVIEDSIYKYLLEVVHEGKIS